MLFTLTDDSQFYSLEVSQSNILMIDWFRLIEKKNSIIANT